MKLHQLTYLLIVSLLPVMPVNSQEVLPDSATAICTDSLTVEFPESMEFDIDSLMGLWKQVFDSEIKSALRAYAGK